MPGAPDDVTQALVGAATSRLLRRAGQPTIHVRGGGQGDIAFVFLHGFGDGAYIWNEVAPQIASSRRWIAPDLRGHGDSDWGEAVDYEIATYAQDTDDLLTDCGPAKWVLVGHSLGGEIAARLAASRRNSVVAVVLADFSPTTEAAVIARVRENFDDAAGRRFASLDEYRQHLTDTLPLGAESAIANIVDHALRRDPRGGFVLKSDPRISAKLADSDRGPASAARWSTLRSISAPVLVVRGVGSAALSQTVADRMVTEALPRGSAASVPMAGHALMVDNPKGFVAVLQQFLARLDLAAPDGAAHG